MLRNASRRPGKNIASSLWIDLVAFLIAREYIFLAPQYLNAPLEWLLSHPKPHFQKRAHGAWIVREGGTWITSSIIRACDGSFDAVPTRIDSDYKTVGSPAITISFLLAFDG